MRRSSAAAAALAAALAAVAALIAGPAALARAADSAAAARAGDRATRIAEAYALVGGAAAAPGGFAGSQWADVHCAGDARGDTFHVEEPNGPPIPLPGAPRGDIREICADYPGSHLALRLRFEEPTNPFSDPNWLRGQTSVVWFVDATGDDLEFNADYAVAYEPGPEVSILRRDEGGQWTVEVCRGAADPAFEDGFVVARGIPAACVGDTSRIRVGAVTSYDLDHADPDAPIALDTSDHLFSVGRSGQPTLRANARLAGPDRFATAVAISRSRYPGSATAVYLARADGFVDALAASSLSASGATDGPILLVPTCGAVPAVVLEEIARLDPPEVVALGGEAAVCEDVLATAAGAGGTGRPADRLEDAAEPTRWGTAAAIARRAYPVGGVEEVYLATGERFPDALAAGPLDAGPVLLVPGCGDLPAVVERELARLDAQRVVALGGTDAVCEDVLVAAGRAGGRERGTDRLAGPTRFDTAAEIARYRFPRGADDVFVARADDFPDALAGAVLRGGPILLVPRCGDLPPPVAREIRRLDPDRVTALGGQQAICQQTLRHAANA